MEIQKSKRGRKGKAPKYNNFADNDFASILYESKFDKFKPALKVLVVIILIMSAAWGVSAYFGGTDKKNDSNKNYASDTLQSDEDVDTKLSQCLADARATNPTPDTSNDDFWPKLIAGYDAQLGCYDQYPDAHGVISRSSTESARESAIDSSGGYKDTYLSTNSYAYKPSTSSGSSQYASPNTPGSGTSAPNNNSQTTGSSSTQPAVDTQWCSTKKAEVDSLYASYQAARNKVQAIDAQIQKVSTSSPPGFTGTQSQLDSWRASERQRLTTEKAPLVTQQDSASASYNTAQSEYRSRSCY